LRGLPLFGAFVCGAVNSSATAIFNPKCTTRQNELVLGMPACAYAYLGKTVPDFGDAALAFPFDDIAGHMSPFDTGGLVEHIKPVSECEAPIQRHMRFVPTG